MKHLHLKVTQRTSDTLIGYLPIFRMLPYVYDITDFLLNRALDVLGTN